MGCCGGSGHWISGAIGYPGALHRELKVPAGKKIPRKRLVKAEDSDNSKLAARARLAITLRKMQAK